MRTDPADVSAALAALRQRWGPAAPRTIGALAMVPLPAELDPAESDPSLRPDRHPDHSPAIPVVGTGFPALDAILGPGGLPRTASVALRGRPSSGRTTLALRLVAEAQAAGCIVAWLDLERSLDPVEAVARGVRLEWLVVLASEGLDEGLSMAGALLGARTVDLLVVDLPARPERPAQVAERFARLAALARRAGTLLVVLEPPATGRSDRGPDLLGSTVGLRLELDRRSWIRLGRDVVGQRIEVVVARNRFGPPGGRAELRILYADGGPRDACLREGSLLMDGSSGRERASPFEIADPPTDRPSLPDRTSDPAVDPSDATPPPPLAASAPPAGPGSGVSPRLRSFPTGPIVLGGQPWTDRTVIDADPLARTLGIRRGMPLGAAHRLAPEASFLDPAPEADAAAVEAAFERLATFSPGLAGTADPADPAFGLLEVQVDGLARLWGDDPTLATRLAEAVASILPGPPRTGIAGTRFAATVAAAHAPAVHDDRGPRSVIPLVVPPGGEAAFLGPLPVTLLTRDPDVRARLLRFGLRRIEAVAALPRSALVARFGVEGARLHDRANGEETDPFRPRRAPERLALGLPIEPPVEDLEPLRFVLRRLAAALADQLLARGAAADRVRARLDLDVGLRPGAPPILELAIRFPEPTADAEAVERLVLAQLERRPPPAPVERLELELLGVGPAAGQQLPLFVPQAARDARLGWQLARLALAYGEDRLLRAELLDPDAAVPERRARFEPAATVEVGLEAGG